MWVTDNLDELYETYKNNQHFSFKIDPCLIISQNKQKNAFKSWLLDVAEKKLRKHHEKIHVRKLYALKEDTYNNCYYQKNFKIESSIEKDINYFKNIDHEDCDKINIALQRTLK